MYVWGPPSLLYKGYRVFPGGKERPGRDADPLTSSTAVVMKGYSPYGPYGLYRASGATDRKCYPKIIIHVLFIVSLDKRSISLKGPGSAGISRDSGGAQDTDKRYAT